MNEKPLDSFPSNWEKEKLDSLRAQLDHSGDLQKAMDTLLKHVATHGQEFEVGEVGDEMISLIVSEAHKGAHIFERFPAFFEELLKNAELRKLFLDALHNVLEESGEDLLVEVPDADLGFLKRHTVQPAVEIFNKDKWRVRWQRTVAQLESVISPPDLAYRSDANLFEDPWFTLLRDELVVGGSALAVVLEGTLSKVSDDSLEVILKVAVTDLATQEDRPPKIRALLQWGDFSEEIQITEQGQKTFPPIPLDTILDKNKQAVISGLQLSLEPA